MVLLSQNGIVSANPSGATQDYLEPISKPTSILAPNRIGPVGQPIIVPGKTRKPIATRPEPCDQKKRIIGGSLDYAFYTLTTAGGNAQADVPVLVPIPDAGFIFVANITPAHLTDSLWMHFIPTGKSYATGTIAPVGNEQWFPLCQQGSALTKIGLMYDFGDPLPPTIYFDIGQETNGTAYFITLLFAKSKAVVPSSMFANVA
jgi:hypothetical protein